LTGDWGDEEDGNALGKGERLKGKGGIFFFLFAQCPMSNTSTTLSTSAQYFDYAQYKCPMPNAPSPVMKN